jgi:hypothetical protein
MRRQIQALVLQRHPETTPPLLEIVSQNIFRNILFGRPVFVEIVAVNSHK